MIYQLVVPGPIEDVEEVRVLEWHRDVGQPIATGELLVELETHKALVEVRSGQQGVVREILCPAGDWRAIGQPLALLSDGIDEALPSGSNPGPLSVSFEVT